MTGPGLFRNRRAQDGSRYDQHRTTDNLSSPIIDSTLPILLADPLAAVRYSIRSLLRDRGFDCVRETDSGEGIVRMLSREAYGLLISDGGFLGPHGGATLKAIRGAALPLQLPVIVLIDGDPVPGLAPDEPLVRCIAKLRGANCSMRLLDAIYGILGWVGEAEPAAVR